MTGKKVLSIEVGNILTKVCEIDYRKKVPKIYRSLVFPTPANTVEDGYIRDKEHFVECFRAEIIKANITTTDVIFTINSAKITSREVTIPFVKDNRIKDVINANLSEYFPMNLDDYTITHYVLEKKKIQEERGIRMLIFAAPNNLLKNYYNVADLLGFTIESIDYIGNSVFQIIKKQTAPGVQMILQLNEENSIVYLIEDSTLLFQRTVPYGIDGVVESVIESKCYSATNPIEALELLQKEHILNGQLNLEIDKSETAATYIGSEELYRRQMEELEAKEEATSTLNYLINNIVRMEEYCAAKFKEKRINNIYITGIGAKLRGIHTLINYEVGIDVKRIERLIGVSFKNTINQVDESIFLPNIGAALHPLDFIPEEIQQSKEKQGLKVIYWFIAGSALISLGLVAFSTIMLNDSKNRLHELQSEELQLKPIEEIYQQYLMMGAKATAMESLYTSLLTKNNELVSLIEKIETIFPKKSYVHSLSATDGGLDLSITTSTKEQIAELIIRLEQIEEIESVGVGAIVENKDNNGLKSFDTALSLRYVR